MYGWGTSRRTVRSGELRAAIFAIWLLRSSSERSRPCFSRFAEHRARIDATDCCSGELLNRCESQIGSSRADQELRQPAWATPAMARISFTAMLSYLPQSPSPPQTPGIVPERRAATPRLLTVGSRPGSPPAPAASDPHIATPFPADDLDGAPECAGWAAANRLQPRLCPRPPGHEVAASSRYSTRSVATEPAGRRPPIVLPSTAPDPPSLARPAPGLPPDASHPPRAGCLPPAVPPSMAIPVHPDASASQKSQLAAARGKLRRQSCSPQSPAQ